MKSKSTHFKLYNKILQLDLKPNPKIILSYYTWINNFNIHEFTLSDKKVSLKLGLPTSTFSDNKDILIKEGFLIEKDGTITSTVDVEENSYIKLYYSILQSDLKPSSKLILSDIYSFYYDKKDYFKSNPTLQSFFNLKPKQVRISLKELDGNNIINRIRLEQIEDTFYYNRQIDFIEEGLMNYLEKVIVEDLQPKKVQENSLEEPTVEDNQPLSITEEIKLITGRSTKEPEKENKSRQSEKGTTVCFGNTLDNILKD